MNQPKKDNKKRNLLIIICVLIAFPFLVVAVSGHFYDVDYLSEIQTMYVEIASNYSIILGDIGLEAIISVIAITIMIISVGLLFRFEDEKIGYKEPVARISLRKIFFPLFIHNKRRFWHILLGYSLILIFLQNFISRNFMDYQNSIGKTVDMYQAHLVIIPVILIIILTARLLSKLDLDILSTNIGIFIFIVYLSEFFYEMVTYANTPAHLLVLFWYSP